MYYFWELRISDMINSIWRAIKSIRSKSFPICSMISQGKIEQD